MDRVRGERRVVEHARGREHRGVVPELAIRLALVIRANERGTRRGHTLAKARGGGAARVRRIEEIGGNAELQQPDGLEIRAEEGT